MVLRGKGWREYVLLWRPCVRAIVLRGEKREERKAIREEVYMIRRHESTFG